eukprot:4319802-Pyramimonas_sp.AAC.1
MIGLLECPLSWHPQPYALVGGGRSASPRRRCDAAARPGRAGRRAAVRRLAPGCPGRLADRPGLAAGAHGWREAGRGRGR